MAKYRVLRSIHVQKEGPKDERGRQKVVTYAARTNDDGTPAGDIVESNVNLTKHNKSGRPKFALIPEVEPIKSVLGTPNDDLDKMTNSALRAFAEENQIDLGDATLKADILRIVRSELNAVEA